MKAELILDSICREHKEWIRVFEREFVDSVIFYGMSADEAAVNAAALAAEYCSNRRTDCNRDILADRANHIVRPRRRVKNEAELKVYTFKRTHHDFMESLTGDSCAWDTLAE